MIRNKCQLNYLTEYSSTELLMNLTEIVGDRKPFIYSDSVQKIPEYPIVLFGSQGFWVRCENLAFCKTDCLKEAMTAAAMSYEIFNIRIPQEIVGVVKFFLY